MTKQHSGIDSLIVKLISESADENVQTLEYIEQNLSSDDIEQLQVELRIYISNCGMHNDSKISSLPAELPLLHSIDEVNIIENTIDFSSIKIKKAKDLAVC